MKMKKKKKTWCLTACLTACLTVCLAVCLAGCSNTDNDALRADLDALAARIAALEAATSDLNTNLRALHELTREGMTITEAVAKNGVYTLTLSDGTTLRLIEKTAATVPLIGIDANGNWQVSYDAGATYTPLLGADGQPIPARAADGLTPAFRINAEGYWQVSYDNGAHYQPVLDEQGNPVKAVVEQGESGDTAFFISVTPTDTSLDIVLRDGTQLSVPIVKNFFCYFDARYTGVQTVKAGTSATFDVHLKGTDNVLITTPTGWTAVLGEPNPATDIATLTVTAPTTTSRATTRRATTTRATADNSKDITLLATAGTFAQIAKIQVTR